jgi:hypothetical protein
MLDFATDFDQRVAIMAAVGGDASVGPRRGPADL